MTALAVLVVSADPLARAGLAGLLGDRPDLEVVGETAPRDAAAAARARPGAALLWDLGPAPGEPPPIAEASAPTLALAADEAAAAEALRAGAQGVLSRGAPAEAIAAALHAVVQELTVLDPAVASGFVHAPEGSELAEPLTPREREVLALLAEGLANKAIGARLGISEHTAKFHVNAILGKLGVVSRAEAIVRAARMGLVVL